MNLRSRISELKSLWWWVRQVFGDAAYENYIRSRRKQQPQAGEAALLSQDEFYLDMLRRRYSGVSRCC